MEQNADILCIQELKAQEADLSDELKSLPGYHGFFHCARKKGYSGCGLWSRRVPDAVRIGFGEDEFDAEGRCVEADFGRLTVISAYFPSGSSSDERQLAKFRFLERFEPHLKALKDAGREVVLCGDVNIAHKEIDIKNWKGNLDHSGSCQKSGPGSIISLMKWAGLMCSEDLIRARSAIHGGASAGRRVPRTWVGVLITSLLPQALPRLHGQRISTQRKNFPITLRSGWTMRLMTED